MKQISSDQVQKFRLGSFHLTPNQRVRSQAQAVDFVNQRGFIFFWPIKGVIFPSLWAAVAGDRPVADAHDDPGHITWGWKDDLLGKENWYYAKILRKKATMISMELAPFFYALSENYGAYDEDYLFQYKQGLLTQDARQIYEALLKEGPLDTIALRRAAHLSSPSSESRFARALAELQSDFKIVPVAVSQAGGWRYAFVYDITARHYPDIPNIAHQIKETEARVKILSYYFASVGVAQAKDVTKLFAWRPPQVQQTLERMVKAGDLVAGIQVESAQGEWFSTPTLL